MNEDRFNAFLEAHAEGTLDEPAARELLRILKADTELRRRFMEELRLLNSLNALPLLDESDRRSEDVILCILTPGIKADMSVAVLSALRREVDSKQRRSAWRPLAATAAALALMLTAGWLWLTPPKSQGVTVIEAAGNLFQVNEGLARTELTNGNHLSSGTIETAGESASATLLFHDGTLVTLNGDTILSFTDEGQKLLLLRRGSISSRVRPQPKDKPMLVRTSSAVAQIVGTAFNLSARNEDTLLKVDEGTVKLRRLADGSTIDVTARNSAVASIQARHRLSTSVTPAPTTEWTYDFGAATPPEEWRGVSDGKQMTASPYPASGKDSPEQVTHFGISIRTSLLTPPQTLRLTEKSTIRYRLKQNQDKPLQLMLLTSKAEGGFGGNFQAMIERDQLKPGPDG